MAAPARPAVLSPAEGALTRTQAVTVRVRAGGPAMRVIVGSTDVTRRFGRARKGVRTAQLRRGRELIKGTNRIVVSAGRGRDRRHAARTFVVAYRKKGALKVARGADQRAALHLRVRGPVAERARFDHVSVTLNGRRVRDEWILGRLAHGSAWPVGLTRFEAMFGTDDGLRFGPNRVVMTAWSARGDFERVARTVTVSRAAPLVSAGPGVRTVAGRRVALDGRRTRPAPGKRVALRWRVVEAPRGSRARVLRPTNARPGLVTDRPGRYRVRLVARHRGAPASGAKVVQQAGTGPGAADETVVDATPATPPIGLPLQTMAAGGISVGATTYPAPAGAG